MDRLILKALPVDLTFEDLRQRLMLAEEDDIALMRPLFEEAMRIARPKAVSARYAVEAVDGPRVHIGGHTFLSDTLARNLAGVSDVWAYVVSCGTEVDDWSHQETDPIVGLWLDMLKELILGQARGHFLHEMRQRTGWDGMSSMNPGSGDVDVWPIEQQRELFSLIGAVAEDTGVRLTDSFLMLPTKSSSGILFPTAEPFVTCTLCSRLRCPNRRAAYQPH